MNGEMHFFKWGNHNDNILGTLSTVRSRDIYCDASICCDGKLYSVHKLVLAACSDYFGLLLEQVNASGAGFAHPVIVLPEVRPQHLEALLDLCYLGEVQVEQDEVPGLIKAANALKFKGLTNADLVQDDSHGKTHRHSKTSRGVRSPGRPSSRGAKSPGRPRKGATSQDLHILSIEPAAGSSKTSSKISPRSRRGRPGYKSTDPRSKRCKVRLERNIEHLVKQTQVGLRKAIHKSDEKKSRLQNTDESDQDIESYGRSRGSKRSQSRRRKSVNFEDLGNQAGALDILIDNLEMEEGLESRGRGRPRKVMSFKEYSRESSRDASSSNESSNKSKRGRKRKDKKSSSDKQKDVGKNHGRHSSSPGKKTSGVKKRKLSSSSEDKAKSQKEIKDNVSTITEPIMNGSSTPLQSTDKTEEIEYINGGRVQVLDMRDNKWYQCKIVDVNWGAQCVLVHYNRWSSRFDEWINMNSYRIQHTNIPKADLEKKRQPTSAQEKVANESSKLSNGPEEGTSGNAAKSDKSGMEDTQRHDANETSTLTSEETPDDGENTSPKVAGAAKRKKKPSIKRNPGSPDKQMPSLNDSMSESEDSSKVTSISTKPKLVRKYSEKSVSSGVQLLAEQRTGEKQTPEKPLSAEETCSDPVYSEEISDTVADILSRLDAEDTTDSLTTVQAISEADHAASDVSSVSTDDILHSQDDSGHSSDHAVSELISPTIGSDKSTLDISDIVSAGTNHSRKSPDIEDITPDNALQKNADKVAKEGDNLEGNSYDKKSKISLQNQENLKEVKDMKM